MKFYVPRLGDMIQIKQDLNFTLDAESRNLSLWKYIFATDKDFADAVNADYPGTYVKGKIDVLPWELKNIPYTIPKGTVLIVDRVFVRAGARDFDSVTFIIQDDPNFDTKNDIRFYVRLSELNGIKFEMYEV